MDKDKVLNLTKLSRIKIDDAEAEKLSYEFDSILNYVSEVRGVGKSVQEEFPVRNVMREDGEPHESGIYTEKILEQAPSHEKNYIKVKKIL